MAVGASIGVVILLILFAVGLVLLLAWFLKFTYNNSIPQMNTWYNKIDYGQALSLMFFLIVLGWLLFGSIGASSMARSMKFKTKEPDM